MAGPLSVFILRLANRINVDLKRDTILEEEAWNKGWMDFFWNARDFFELSWNGWKIMERGGLKEDPPVYRENETFV